jgi:predicted nucleic acid-binding protein
VAAVGRPPLPRGVLAFDEPGWVIPDTVLLDTSVAAEALLPNQPEHAACAELMRRLADAGSTVLFSQLLELELWETVFNLALRERHPRKNLRHVRYDSRVRPRAGRLLREAHRAWDELLSSLTWSRIEIGEVAASVPSLMEEYGLQSYDAVHAATLLASGVTDFLTRDGGFAVLPAAITTLHTTRGRLSATRARRRRGGYSGETSE